jgi:ABC-type multidrug transport system ATPase subunit
LPDIRCGTRRGWRCGHIGVVFQQIALDLDLSVRRNLLFQADLQGVPRGVALARIEAGLRPAGSRCESRPQGA